MYVCMYIRMYIYPEPAGYGGHRARPTARNATAVSIDMIIIVR